MVHNFFKRNKKKAVISTVILSLLALSVCVVCIYNSKILAGVFQSHKNEDGTMSYVQKNTIEILEIVAQDGQQVLGYTVEGSEPIKPEQIETYSGDINFAEFLNATGYDVSGSPGNYTINSSHNNAFNENVLSGMMYTEDDQIVVNVVMASALTEEDIKNADLIYISNPADNDENLLYYYDQIVNNGRNGIAKGDKGRTYTGSIEEQIAVKEYAVDKICKAAGRRENAERLTADDFKKAEAENFYDYNLSEYINEIAELQRDSLNGSNTDESVSKISVALDKINIKLKENALNVIKSYVNPGSIADEDREKLIIALKQREYSNFYEVNEQDYVDFIVSTKRNTDSRINSGMSQVNEKNFKESRDLLKDIKNGVDIKADSTDDEYTALVSKSIAQLFYSSETYNKLNAEAYAVKFIEDEADYDTTQNSVFIQELEDKIISVVNAEEKESALTTLAELAANRTETDDLKNNIDAADRLFMLSELEEYKSFNIERYLDAIGDLTDAKALMSMQENEDGTWSEKYSEDKMNAVLKSVNDSPETIQISCDIPWSTAMKLYEYVTVNGRALTYNAELLTGKTIGDYTNPNEEKNSNSMYKFLLVLRQMTPEYFRNTVLPRIDGDGNYDDGTGSGVNGKWYAGTFCSAWNNESAANKNNFCEPAVVGKLYDTAGNVIGNAVYIKDNIFSFSGEQFFGGKKFYVDTEDYNEVAGSFTTTKVEYVESSFEPKNATQSNNLLCAELPVNAKNAYCFVGNSGWRDFNRGATVDISGYSDGTVIKLSMDKHTLSEYPRQKDWDGWSNYDNPSAYYIVYKIDSIEDGKIPSNPSVPDMKKIYFDVSAISYWDKTHTIVHYTTVTENVVSEEIDKTKGEILREIMGISLNQLQSMPFKVLEIQPDGNVNEFNSYDGAVRLADYLRIDVPDMNSLNWEDYFKIEPISIREFNTRHEELNGTYDLIYFGTKTRYMSTKKYNYNGEIFERTEYGNSKVMGESYYMNGLVYTGIGQQRQVGGSLRGTVADDYYTSSMSNMVKADHDLWTKYFFAEFSESGSNNYLNPGSYYLQKTNYVNTRMTGNDLTVAKMDDLLEYVKAGYPVLFADGLLNSDEDFKNADTMVASSADAVKWKYLDNNSKLYAFIQQAKALGKDASGQYTDTSALYDNKPYASLVSVKYAKYGKNPDKLTAAEKFNGGLSFAVKRNVQVDFEYIKGPQEYDRDTSGNMLPMGSLGTYITDLNSCMCVLKPNIVRENVMEWINDNYSFRFLIDKSGTANFPANQTIELDVYSYFDENNNEVTVSTRNGKWPTGLEGFIPWKVEAVSKNNSGNRWTYVGYSAFKKSDPDPVRVLWVKSEASGNGAISGSTLDFKHMMDKYDGKLPGSTDYIPEYDIRVDTIYYKQFVSNWNNVSQEEKDNPYDKNRSRIKVDKLNGIVDKGTKPEDNDREYDMIVIGYSDSYAKLDIDNIYCLNNIDYFVNKADHSMLFAHDNASFITSFNYYINGGGGTSIKTGDYSYNSHNFIQDFARYTTSYMRGMLGMDAYGSSYSPLAFNAANTDTDKEYLSWLYKYTPSVYNARAYITDNPANPALDELSDMRGYVDGQILWYSTSYQSWPLNNSGTRIGDNKYGEWVNTKGIECTNKGQIAIYPFVIGDSLTVDSETHFQYTKLDIEDNDTTVWYTLANSGTSPYYDATKGDGSNNYYIYSNGNITYTGAGHRFIADDAKECLLFVNTVVAAIKLGSLAPDVTYPDAVSVNGEDVLYGYDTDSALKVTFKATDYDVLASGAYAFVDAQIFLDKDNNGKYDPAAGDVLLNSPAKMPTGVTYLRDQNGAAINFDGTDIVNRQDTTFYLNYDDLAGIYDSLGLEPKTKNIDKVKALFDNSNNYRICVNVLSKLQEEKAKKEAADLSTVQNYYQYANARVILRALHDLR